MNLQKLSDEQLFALNRKINKLHQEEIDSWGKDYDLEAEVTKSLALIEKTTQKVEQTTSGFGFITNQ